MNPHVLTHAGSPMNGMTWTGCVGYLMGRIEVLEQRLREAEERAEGQRP